MDTENPFLKFGGLTADSDDDQAIKKFSAKRFDVFKVKGGKRGVKLGDIFAPNIEEARWEAIKFFVALGWSVDVARGTGTGRARAVFTKRRGRPPKKI